MAGLKDNWGVGELYEPYVGRWSRKVATQFLAWLELAPDLEWLDVGCGTGALTETILLEAKPASVVAVDPSRGFVQYAQENIPDPRASFEGGDAQKLALDSDSFDVAVGGLMLNFVPQPALAAAEMARVVKPGGTVAAYVWDYAGRMQLMRHFWEAAVELNPGARELDEGSRFPLCQPAALEQLLVDAGMDNVELRAIDIATPFSDFDDYWSPFLGGQGSAPTYVMSLNEGQRTMLRERLRQTLPQRADGAIELSARAWAVRATVV
ncbi:methyltransferase domain-containing protein [Variovorax sp. J22R133]|uniref:class I SAM-dependent methyltransferase n=1 Tax=Variovorax brevis TaxID=3053503 RepID=UPI002578C78E|nr:methyltransferase domain-containing protein [Variovorax sp. J22R133]MDM0114980.1 methyltransferase domain-containing protein [Variovorax sp. J22R133]